MDPTLTQSGQAADAKVTGDNLSMLSDAIVSSQSGEEIQLRDSSNRGLEGLKVYGKATQQRTTGAQLLDCYSASVEGVNTSYVINKNEITVSGTVAWSYASYNITDFKGQQITISGAIVGGANARVVVAYVAENDPTEKNLVFITDVGLFTKTVTIPTDATLAKIKLYANASNFTFEKANDCVYKNIMLNAGSTALPWEPYTGGQPSPSPEYPQEITVSGDGGEINVSITDGNLSQSLLLSTPNGLPGIPVTSGGNYTDADGQQWVCDEIDLATGVRRQRIGVETLTSVQMASEESPPEGRFGKSNIFGTKYRDASYPAVCNKATWGSWAAPKDNVWIFAVSNIRLYLSPPKGSGYTVETLNAYLAEQITADNPLIIYGQLATPIETPLTPEEIAAYQSLHTYQPVTNILTDTAPQAGIEVAYVADTKAYIDRRLDSIEAKIAATQAQIL